MIRLFRIYGLVIIESAICFFGMRGITIRDAWSHPFHVFIVLVTIIVAALAWTMLGAVCEYKRQRKNLLNKNNHVKQKKSGEEAA